jgi:hypothetical protein
MARKIALGFVVLALVALPAGSAWAEGEDDDGFIGVGARFQWENYKTPLINYSGMDVQPGLPASAYGSPNFGGSFHWGITNQFVLSATLDFGFFSHTIYPYPDRGAKDIKSVTANFVQFGAMLGVKYFFSEREAGKVSLYLGANVGAYFAGATSNAKIRSARNAVKNAFYDPDDCDTFPSSCDGEGNKYEDDDLDDEWDDFLDSDAGDDIWDDAKDDDEDAQKAIDKQMEMVGRLASPFVLEVAVGAEFFATDTFSIGADILGIRFTYASADVGEVDATDMSNAEWTGEQSLMSIYIY